MKKLLKLAAVLLAVTIPAGCGSRIKKNEAQPTEAVTEAAAAEATPALTQAADTPAPAATEHVADGSDNPAVSAEQSSTQKIPESTAEKLVIEATGATGLKLVSEGDAYVFDCFNGNDYMGTVEVNAVTGELTFQ